MTVDQGIENHPKNPLGQLKWQVVQIKPESTGRGYCFGTATQSAQVRIPRPYRPLRKSRQKSPGGLKWHVVQIKPESTGEGGDFFAGGGGIIGSGGCTVLGHRRKVQKCKFQARTTPLENHPKIPWGAKMAGFTNKTREHR